MGLFAESAVIDEPQLQWNMGGPEKGLAEVTVGNIEIKWEYFQK